MPKIRTRFIVLEVLFIIATITTIFYKGFLNTKNFQAPVIKKELAPTIQGHSLKQTQKYGAGSSARINDRLNYFIHKENVNSDWMDDLFITNRLDDFFSNVKHKTEVFFDDKEMKEWYLRTNLEFYK